MPITVTVTELTGLVTMTVPVRLPPLVGVKVTLNVQLEFADSIPPVIGHGVPPVAVTRKSLGSVPPTVMIVIAALEVELFVSVTGIAELWSVICVPGNAKLDEFTVSAGVTLSIPITEVVPVVAVTVTGVELLTVPAGIESINVATVGVTVVEGATGAIA